ncbi:unnamed protein product [Caenorhabditis auriculariae]|uniref:non-specific serine/threonine protein kinase n=1 Tax=Caenorhabditis auriculariae TaxID=2777116 RepID=A0A8S1HPC8_9PELO|nr:unnamed protein product [Caenorhabditis auriculariae]
MGFKKKAKKTSVKKTPSKSKLSAKKKEKKEKKKKEKKEKKKKKEQPGETISESSSSDSTSPTGVGDVIAEAVNQTKMTYMLGACKTPPPIPEDFMKRLMACEQPDLFQDGVKLTNEECELLDEHLKKTAVLKKNEFLVNADSTNETNLQRFRVVEKYNEGRFGAVYVTTSEFYTEGEADVTPGQSCMVKACLRMGHATRVRMIREIRMMRTVLAHKDQKRIMPLLCEGRVLGVPFLVMPAMDANLEKTLENVPTLSIPSVLFIAQEMLVAIKSCHKASVVHRDIKPTNFVMGQNLLHWYLADFGEAYSEGKRATISPPDGYTLPYFALDLHLALKDSVVVKKSVDVEMWFYVILRLLKVLPWQKTTVYSEVRDAKIDFWKKMESKCANMPEVVRKLAKHVCDEGTASAGLSKILEEGFLEAQKGRGKFVPDWNPNTAPQLPSPGPQSSERPRPDRSVMQQLR